jgi:hypothetical protein
MDLLRSISCSRWKRCALRLRADWSTYSRGADADLASAFFAFLDMGSSASLWKKQSESQVKVVQVKLTSCVCSPKVVKRTEWEELWEAICCSHRQGMMFKFRYREVTYVWS